MNTPCLQTLIIMALLVGFLAAPSSAQLDEASADTLSANLVGLSSGQNLPLARETIRLLLNPFATESDWSAFFSDFFNAWPFTQPLAEFFAFAMQNAPSPGLPRVATAAAMAGAAAGAPLLANMADVAQPVDGSALFSSLATMQQALPLLPDQGRREAFSTLTAELQGRVVDLTGALLNGGLGNSFDARLAMMVCVTLDAYATPGSQRGEMASIIRLPTRTRTFWLNTGTFLFDNGALSGLHVTSLESLMRSIPANLHDIVALVAPEAYGLDAAAPGLVLARQLVLIPNMSMDILTAPNEFAARIPSPQAPDFTATMAANLFRAIQDIQFARRPQLAVRRDTILARAGLRDVTYLRWTVAPELFLSRPEDFLPQTAYLWFINSEAAFRMALDFFRLRQQEPMETLLLIADILSNGSDVTLMFDTSPTGIVTSAQTQLGRVPDPETGFLQANAIYILGQEWRFTLGPTGELTSLIRVGGAFAL